MTRSRDWIRLPHHIATSPALAAHLESLAAQMRDGEPERAEVIASVALEVRTRPLGALAEELRQRAASELDPHRRSALAGCADAVRRVVELGPARTDRM